MKKPEKIIKLLPVEMKKSEFVDWNGKEKYDYSIPIPSWLAHDFVKHRCPLVLVEFSSVPIIKQLSRQTDVSDYFKERWSARIDKMRRLNNGYMKVMPIVQPRSSFETHEGYIKYHKELEKLNKKYMKTSS